MYRSPKLRVAQRGRVVWPSLTIVERTGCFVNLCGLHPRTSVGFPVMYRPPKLRGASGRAVAAWLLLEPCEPLWDLCGTSVYLAGPFRASRQCIVLLSCVLRSADVLCGRR